MKNILFGLIATVLLSNFSFGQTSNESWKRMMQIYETSINNIILKECPKDVDLNKFKISLINGEKSLSESGKNEIINASKPLKEYGLEFAKKNKLDVSDESNILFYSSFSPDMPVEDGQIIVAKLGGGLTWADVGNCALAALGADALYSLAFSGASSWSIAALTTTFTGVAKRFLGPIGVGIAVVSFGLCLAEAYAN